jgi:hypothetical protein
MREAERHVRKNNSNSAESGDIPEASRQRYGSHFQTTLRGNGRALPEASRRTPGRQERGVGALTKRRSTGFRDQHHAQLALTLKRRQQIKFVL